MAQEDPEKLRSLLKEFRTGMLTSWSADGRLTRASDERCEDPALCIVCVRPVEGEYWDNRGARGLKYLFDAAKAYVTGTTPEATPQQHGTVNPR